MKSKINEGAAIKANTNTTKTQTNPDESANVNKERLAELAAKIRNAYNKEHESGVMVTDWKAKQLKAGIEMGTYLKEAKSLLPHKKFLPWCRDNFADLSHRTLNRYMRIAGNKDETHVSNAAGLRQAHMACSKPAIKPESTHKIDLDRVQQHLIKAKDMLNSYTNLNPCEEADAICDLVCALNIWVNEYKASKDARALNKVGDVEFEMPLGDEKQTSQSKADAEISLAE